MEPIEPLEHNLIPFPPFLTFQLHLKPFLCKMKFLLKGLFVFAGCLFISISLKAQALDFPSLFKLLDTEPALIDTVMKSKHYNILQRDKDSTSLQYYYNNVERGGEGVPNWVRSVTYAQVSVNTISSRLITYRTYRKKEYQELMAWLLNNNFHTTKTYDFDKEKHTIFSDGSRTVLLKIGPKALPNGTKVLAYELEIGK